MMMRPTLFLLAREMRHTRLSIQRTPWPNATETTSNAEIQLS